MTHDVAMGPRNIAGKQRKEMRHAAFDLRDGKKITVSKSFSSDPPLRCRKETDREEFSKRARRIGL
jgi:hypothetical protein